MRPLPVLCALALLVAGCAAPGATLDPGAADAPIDGLAAPGAAETLLNADGTLSFVFEGKTPAAVGVLVSIPPTPLRKEAFEVDGRVGFVEANLTVDGGLVAFVKDAGGRTQCGAVAFVDPPTCTAPVDADAVEEWTVELRPSGLGATLPDTPYTITVTLHPPSHITRGDPMAGVDPTVTFRVSDTGVAGAEDNIGLLPDGTILTQKATSTMRSFDDGVTWENVAPPGNDRVTLDPMLFVDPWRGRVFVDHLYVACSALSWSTDAGESWVTNPAACGRPGNDHQKVASGPNPIPGAPFPAVYYSYSIPGVWASRSLDGGVTWTSVPVAGVTDGREPSNTGPIYADEAGNVFVPMYMCDKAGYIGVGVSHDHGATFKYVTAADDPGPCRDVDPGLWTDTDGTVYLAYHRPDGVKYVYSTDHGETWSAPVAVSPPSLRSFVHVDAVAGDPGRLAIVYRATPDTAKGPDSADGWAAWHLYVTFVENATSATPTIRTGIVNDPDDPVQRGPICTLGIACVGGSRNLLDFIDIAVGPDGRVYPTFTDGCDAECPTPADSRHELGLVGIQMEGPRLFAAGAPWAAQRSAMAPASSFLAR